MKRSPSYCSSSSSCIENNTLDHQQQKPKTTRTRAKKNPQADTSAKRSSIFRGVTRHRWTGRYEAHLWDKSTWNSNQSKKGRQIYLGAYDNEEAAARTYDLAAIKYWGSETILNFPIETYMDELEKMKNVSKEEFLASLRRMSSGFSRGVSKYRGVARHHHNGRWEARIGRVFGNKYLYLGTYSTQEEAAAAYDMAAIEYRGPNAVTNFDISTYAGRLKNTLPNTEPLIENQNLKSSIETQADEQEYSDQQEQLENSMVPKYETINFSPSIDTQAMLVMGEHDNEDPWNLCLDTNFDPLLIPDTPLENHGDLPDLFDDIGFEDNIDYIFDTPIFENELIYQDGHSNNMLGKEEKGHEGNLITSPSSSSSWSSSSSTTTSVSWNV